MVTIVSCCSLIGVSIVPLISGPSYKTFITLFTGLAVGSLVGSAIFSLIPQAFGLHLSSDKIYLWKSLVIFFGIYLFYCSERLMRIYFDRRTRKQNSQREEQVKLKKKRTGAASEQQVDSDQNEQATSSNAEDGSGQLRTDSTSARGTNAVDHSHGGLHHHHSHFLEPPEVIAKALKGSDVVDRSNLPAASRIAPVAWMIIIGDGIHNFIDGLSIGAAFTENLGLGVSTSMAVIFEEFPHELGDFAVLIASGMTVREAICFNFLSACTCYAGMVCGIILGDMTSSASYIFALAGGMFLYISLVDMMGELSAILEQVKDSTSKSYRLLLMQNIGILSGITIIFLLTLYFGT